jgi:hypothetical protein
MTRPKVALLVTAYFFGSHADVLGTRMIEGYEWAGEAPAEPRVEVASMYLEQPGGAPLRAGQEVRPDIGVQIADRNGVPLFPTVGEAIGLGQGGVAVDGVVIIGEHGDYEDNEYGQKLYPRRRLFDAAIATMVGAGRMVPIFNDKHLGYSIADAQSMVDTAHRLGVPMVAGSTIPLTWRLPAGSEWPLGERMTGAVTVGYGDAESYGFHALEGHQAHVERRAGGEVGVAAVQTLTGPAARASCSDGTVDPTLLSQALARFDIDEAARARALAAVTDVFLVSYADGLATSVVIFGDVIGNWATACRGPGQEMSCQMWLPGAKPGLPTEHFIFLARQIESMVLTGESPYPIERTLLTTGILDAAMRSRQAGGERRPTPELAVTYFPVADVPDTGVHAVYPEPVRKAGPSPRCRAA